MNAFFTFAEHPSPLGEGVGPLFSFLPHMLLCPLVVVFLAQPGKVSPSWLNAAGLAQYKATPQGPPVQPEETKLVSVLLTVVREMTAMQSFGTVCAGAGQVLVRVQREMKNQWEIGAKRLTTRNWLA